MSAAPTIVWSRRVVWYVHHSDPGLGLPAAGEDRHRAASGRRLPASGVVAMGAAFAWLLLPRRTSQPSGVIPTQEQPRSEQATAEHQAGVSASAGLPAHGMEHPGYLGGEPGGEPSDASRQDWCRHVRDPRAAAAHPPCDDRGHLHGCARPLNPVWRWPGRLRRVRRAAGRR
jgi:hypothetical protein